MPRTKIPPLGRLVTNTEWINNDFLSAFFTFVGEPENRCIRANLQGLGQAGIRLFNEVRVPATRITSELLLRNVVANSHAVKTRIGYLHEGKRGLDLLLMLEFDPALRKEFATVRHNFARATGQRQHEVPATAYGIPLARLDPETVEPQHHLPLVDLVDTIRPDYVILGKAQPLLKK